MMQFVTASEASRGPRWVAGALSAQARKGAAMVMTRGGASEAGFTLVEVCAVMIVTGLVAGISWTALQSHMPSARLDQAAQALNGDLRSARQLAITEGNNYVVTFEPSGRRYRVWDDDGSDGHMDTGETERVVALPTGVTIYAVSFGGSNRVTFRSNGSVVAGGSVDLRCPNPARARIEITRATGHIKLSVTD
jgi:type II secretion system protein H